MLCCASGACRLPDRQLSAVLAVSSRGTRYALPHEERDASPVWPRSQCKSCKPGPLQCLRLICRRDAHVPTLIYAETFGEGGSNGTASYYLG